MRQFRICALCRNLELVEQGREFPQLADTEYAVFRCRIFGWSTRDDYMMESPESIQARFARQEEFDCERWEAHPPG
jgi:hypothetical protein